MQGCDALRAVCWGRWCRCGGSIPAASAERPHGGVACTVSATGALRLRVRGVPWFMAPPCDSPHSVTSKGWCLHAPSSGQVPRDHDGGSRPRRRAHRTSRPGCPGRPGADAGSCPGAEFSAAANWAAISEEDGLRRRGIAAPSVRRAVSGPTQSSRAGAEDEEPAYVLAVTKAGNTAKANGVLRPGGGRRRHCRLTRRTSPTSSCAPSQRHNPLTTEPPTRADDTEPPTTEQPTWPGRRDGPRG